jgi:hypothetical protein
MHAHKCPYLSIGQYWQHDLGIIFDRRRGPLTTCANVYAFALFFAILFVVAWLKQKLWLAHETLTAETKIETETFSLETETETETLAKLSETRPWVGLETETETSRP